MQPSQLSMLPVYFLNEKSSPVHFVHVTDVISKEYAKKCGLLELYEIMTRLGATSAVRTAESQLAIWVPRPGIDSYSLIDQKIPSSRKTANVFLRSNGRFHAVDEARALTQSSVHVA